MYPLILMKKLFTHYMAMGEILSYAVWEIKLIFEGVLLAVYR